MKTVDNEGSMKKATNSTRTKKASNRNGHDELRLTNVAADKHFSDAATPQW